jgi:hypothetical protein
MSHAKLPNEAQPRDPECAVETSQSFGASQSVKRQVNAAQRWCERNAIESRIQFQVIKTTSFISLPTVALRHLRCDMDQQYPELFRSPPAGSSVFNPCATFPHRASRVRDLSSTFLGPPTASSESLGPLGVPRCRAVHASFFYQAFNRYSRDLYQFRKANKLPILSPPLLFNLSGQLISEKFLKRLAAKGPLFAKMPSSCKDIRK